MPSVRPYSAMSARAAGKQGATRTLVVWCLDWPVAALGVDPDRPAAVFHANRVVACTPTARAADVARGMRRREAQRRCPTLEIHERDLAREARAFEPVLVAVDGFAPRVEVTRPGSCALATRGPSRYFGGDETLARLLHVKVTETLAGRTTCRIGVADGVFAAALAARSQMAAEVGALVVPPGESAEFLASRPVTTLERTELVDVLVRLGLVTLGQIAALDIADLVGRFGAEGQIVHRLASGLDQRPLVTEPPPPELAVTAELDPPVERVDQAAFVARALAIELHDRLAKRGQACTRVAIEAETEHGEHLVRLWRHEGALSAGAIADRVRWQLDGWLDGPVRARPTGGLVRLALVPDEVVAATGRQLGFWGGETAADERAKRAVARLEAMLGPEAVTVPVRSGGRGAGEQLRLVPTQGQDLLERSSAAIEGDGRGERSPWPGSLPVPSPAVLGPAVEARLVDDRGEPIRVGGRGLVSAPPVRCSVDGGPWLDIEVWAGPWLVDERWWDPERRRRWARFQIVTADGLALLISVSGGRATVEATYD